MILKEVKEINTPENGWIENAYYVVDACFGPQNPVARYIFFTGFLSWGVPQGYNKFISSGCEVKEYKDAFFINPIQLLAMTDEDNILQPIGYIRG